MKRMLLDRRTLIAWASLVAVTVAVVVADGDHDVRADEVNLSTQAAARIFGAQPGDQMGVVSRAAGDVNGDSKDDLLVTGYLADKNGRVNSGSAWIIFGQDTLSDVDLNSLGQRGFRIDGANAFDHAGYAAAGVGDVNGDGYDDVAIGARDADSNGRSSSGSVYVVFGNASSTDVDAASLGTRGFRIDGAAAGDQFGASVGGSDGALARVTGASDINEDGKDDLVIGAPGADPNLKGNAGSAFVIYGRDGTGPVNTASLGSSGFRIDGANAGDATGASLARLGDIDDDGKTDFAVGAPGYDVLTRTNAGTVWVVFGRIREKITTGVLALTVTLNDLYQINGATANGRLGDALGYLGDLNGDRRGDLIAGAPGIGRAYAVFSQATQGAIDLAGAGWGFEVRKNGTSDAGFAEAVAGAGDVNEDGKPDLLIAAPQAQYSATGQGSAVLVYGKSSTSYVQATSSMGSFGRRMNGLSSSDSLGLHEAIGAAGDFNGDGTADLVVGAPLADDNGRSDSGTVYLVSGTLPDPSIGTSDFKACPSDGTSVDFDQYSVGQSFEGLNRTATFRRCEAPQHGEPARGNYVTSIYGDCTPGIEEEACAPPLEVQTWPACERSLSDYRLDPEGAGLPRGALVDLRQGAKATEFTFEDRLEVYTGNATVVIFGEELAQIRRAAEALIGQTLQGVQVGSNDPLPAPLAGALDGTLAC